MIHCSLAVLVLLTGMPLAMDDSLPSQVGADASLVVPGVEAHDDGSLWLQSTGCLGLEAPRDLEPACATTGADWQLWPPAHGTLPQGP